MDSPWENLIKYFMTICAAGAIAWKFLDAWEKRKSSPVKELESRVTRNEEKWDARVTRCEEEIKKNSSNYEEIKNDMKHQKDATDKVNERFDKVNDSFRDWLRK